MNELAGHLRVLGNRMVVDDVEGGVGRNRRVGAGERVVDEGECVVLSEGGGERNQFDLQ